MRCVSGFAMVSASSAEKLFSEYFSSCFFHSGRSSDVLSAEKIFLPDFFQLTFSQNLRILSLKSASLMAVG